MIRPDDQAFPGIGSRGLTVRELFAAMAMQGLLADGQTREGNTEDDIAAMSVRYADTLIRELNWDEENRE